jgi:multidrug transporter EmrE-like cation transporter
MPLLVVSAAVLLQIAGAVVLKALADHAPVAPALLAAGIGVVALLNGLRFVAWGVAHRRWPLSTTYPLASVFFPLMLGVSYLYGDPVRLPQWLGTALVTAGVVWLTWRVRA